MEAQAWKSSASSGSGASAEILQQPSIGMYIGDQDYFDFGGVDYNGIFLGPHYMPTAGCFDGCDISENATCIGRKGHSRITSVSILMSIETRLLSIDKCQFGAFSAHRCKRKQSTSVLKLSFVGLTCTPRRKARTHPFRALCGQSDLRGDSFSEMC